MKKKIFITGASGFIGSHLTERLIAENYNVTALVPYDINSSIGWLKDVKNIKKVKIIHGDIRDENFIVKHSKNCDILIHLAALISIPYSYESPKSYIQNNVEGTFNVLEAAKRNNIKKVIHTSTSEVYGSAIYTPIDELHPINPQSPYAASKVAADSLAFSYYKSFNIPVCIVRPFNTFGPRQSGRAVITTIIAQLLKNKNKLFIGKTDTKRDFTFVSDTVDAYLKIIRSKKDLSGKTINLGTGSTVSIQDIIKNVIQILNIKPKIIKDKKRFRPKKSEVNLLLSNNAKARKLLKWKPKFSGKKGLYRALSITIDWFKKDKNLNNYIDDYQI